jgi:ATP-binding cassette subfamily F protein uup
MTAQATKPAVKKLSFKEQREYDSLPSLIAQLEKEQAGLNIALADGSLYASDPKSAAVKATRVSQIDDELLAAMERLEVLSQRTTLA